MESDAFNAGVKPGGLRSRTDIRVLICFILDSYKVALPIDRIIEQLHFSGIANYFELTVAVAELEELGTIGAIEEDGQKLYIAVKGARDTAENLKTSIPLSVREHSLEICDKILARRRNERQNRVFTERAEFGVYITCSVMENEMELATVRLLVPDEETAENVKENFLNNPMDVLIRATECLTGINIKKDPLSEEKESWS